MKMARIDTLCALLLTLSTTLKYPSASAFVSRPQHCVRQFPTLRFGYRNQFGEGGSNHNDGLGDEASLQRPRTLGFNVPLIGPIPGGLPLFMGSELLLEPTPMQWKALEESVMLHRQYLKEQENSTITGIDAAPLVAVIDEVSGQSATQGRYATIAAVVGISSTGRPQTIDTSDEISFMESMNQFGSQGYMTPSSSTIRLVGVARSILGDSFYKLPTKEESDVDDQNDDLDDDDLDEDDDDDNSEPIVMAQFTLLTDSPKQTSNPWDKVGNKGAKSHQKAPVHAVNEMNSLANKVVRMHEHRRRLFNGLSAAKARLGSKNIFEDTDGLGQFQRDKEQQAAVEDLLERYDVRGKVGASARLHGLENYGLNYFSVFSSIRSLTDVAMDTFSPYYSPKRQQTDEYRFEILSFVAFRALEGFCTPSDLAWALRCENSAERLSRAYDIMLEHVMLLEEMAQQASSDLRDCGEECTDLW